MIRKPCHTGPMGTKPYVGWFKLCPTCAAERSHAPDQWKCTRCGAANHDRTLRCDAPTQWGPCGSPRPTIPCPPESRWPW